MGRKDEIVWVRRDSVTYKITLAEGIHQFCKSFNPDDIKRGYRQYFGEDNNPGFKPNILQCDSQRSLYHREVRLLTALAEIGQNLVPGIIRHDSEKMQIFMEYLPNETYQSQLKTATGEQQKRDLIEGIINFLGIFHNRCNKSLGKICKEVNKDRTHLRQRSVEEEGQRLDKHFLSILRYSGRNLHSYWEKKGFEPEEATSQKVGWEIRSFLRDKGIDLHAAARYLIKNEREITCREKLFVHGDFRPQNIFYEEKGGSRTGIKVCDFDKVRLSCRNDDLVTGMFNIHTYPFDEEREGFFLQLAENYYLETGCNREELTDRLAGRVVSASRTIIRDFGVHCELNWKEMEWFINDSEKMAYLKSGNPKDKLLEDKFVKGLNVFLDYYLSGEGLDRVISPSSKKDAVCRQLESFKKIFEAGGLGF